ncbi:hypothetical protein MVEG_12178 [Podila verticillata NRRL 6337]|uniref:Endonuclease/exonuclease/phosphatase domain-containing protein n=1 Tax=Podila verticillata NRRL 6337 TaxID=1069443 RepID=A0A086TJ97_9FUNG|nr:hypothetical protein MVEG_12178 [Podila verticillata NRRL 6337]
MASPKRSEASTSTSTITSATFTETTTSTTFTVQKSEALGVNKRSVPLPRPGELLIYDCRPPDHRSRSGFVPQEQGNNNNNNNNGLGSLLNRTGSLSSSPPTPTPTPTFDATFASRLVEEGAPSSSSNSSSSRPIRCLQWNIERNYKANEIIDTLTQLDADILCIQEIDIGCRRSGHERDHFLEICASQGLYGGFVPEFWELEHAGRKDRDQGGGVHGNAILSRWPINGFRVLDHVHHAYEWERDGLKLNEPRLGRRFTIVADIQTPSGPLLCYCAHLEVFTGIVGRISALSDILADSELYSDRYPYQILFGDLNTISHSIARLAKSISTDQYRIGSVGSQEAEWWDRNLWSWHVHDGEFNLALATGGWSWLRRLGFLGIGIGSSNQKTLSGYWYSDKKYTHWLKELVQAGLDKVKQARQDQLAGDTFVTVETQVWQTRQNGTTQTSTSTTIKPLTHDDVDDLQSEKSYQEDGSIILVERPRSPSIVTLESGLLDRNESMSSPSWSSPTSPLSQSFRFQGESEDEDRDMFPAERGYSRMISKKSLSTPSTPSPTLRLIPPTPKERRSLAQGEEGYSNKDEERGVVLQYGNDDETPNDNDDDNDNDHFYDKSNDRHVFTTQPNRTPSETESQHYPFDQDHEYEYDHYKQKQGRDIFKDPQPPFLLSTLGHPSLTSRLWSGFTPLVLHQARNPGFYDPWSARDDLTLHNPNFFGILKAKLDYSLLMNLRCVGRSMGNHDYSASDHKWLLVEVEFEREFKTHHGHKDGKEVQGPSKEQRYLWWRERRQEWDQEVQPHEIHGQDKKKARELYRKNQLIHKHGHGHDRSERSGVFLGGALATAAVAAVVGGLFWWNKK